MREQSVENNFQDVKNTLWISEIKPRTKRQIWIIMRSRLYRTAKSEMDEARAKHRRS